MFNSIMDEAVARYMTSLSVSPVEFAYLGVDSQFCINRIGGAAKRFGFENLQPGGSVVEQLSFLEALLPGDRMPVIIPNAQYIENHFVDLHLFGEPEQQWLLFVDRTEQGKLTQNAQQVRLDDVIIKERLLDIHLSTQHSTSGNDVDQFFPAIERLINTYSDSFQSLDEKLSAILLQALDYFQLDTALLSCVSGDTATLEHVVYKTDANTAFVVGAVLSADRVPCSHLVNETTHVCINDVTSGTQVTWPGFADASIRCCIGAPVHTTNGPFGCVCFYSTKPRNNKFTEKNEKYLLMIAGLLANLQGDKEQLGFVQAQSANYQNLFESVPAAMILSDVDGLVISASKLFSEQVGIEQDLIPGKFCLDFFNPECRTDIHKAILSGDAVAVPAIIKRNKQPPLEVELNVREKLVGAMAGVRMIIATDVSDRNQALRNVTDQNRLLQIANESLDQFAYMASHDLQEPLRKMQQFGFFLEEDLDGKLDDEAKYQLDAIISASKRMRILINNLLNFSRTQQAVIELEAIEFKPFLEKLIAELDVSIEQSGATILIEQLPTVQANAALLSQLFNNLIGNAIKYRKPDTPPIVRIWMDTTPGSLCIKVTDNGIGFDMEHVSQIFKPFNRLHNAQDYDGTGIGLAICKTVCEKHGWTLGAHGVPDEGSTFWIEVGDAQAPSLDYS